MYRLSASPNSINQIFSSLCLSQVKEQLTENLVYFDNNPTSFICNGQLYTYTNNRSFIVDESLVGYGINVNFRDRFN